MRTAEQPKAVTHTADRSTAVLDTAQPLHSAVTRRSSDDKVGDEALRSLARALGRQAARRHLHRGTSITELAIVLALGALIVAALLYAGMLHLGSR